MFNWLAPLLRILTPFFGPIGDFLLRLWRNRGPSEVATEAEKAGAATQAERQATVTANTMKAEAQAETDAPKTIEGVESRLDKGMA